MRPGGALLASLLLAASLAAAAPASTTDPRGDAAAVGPNLVAVAPAGVDLLAGAVTATADGVAPPVYELTLRFADLAPRAHSAGPLRFHAEATFVPETGGLVLVALNVRPDGALESYAYLKAHGWSSAASHAADHDAEADVVTFRVQDARLAGAPADLGARSWLWQCTDGCERSVGGGYGGDGFLALFDEMGVSVRRSLVAAGLPASS